MKKLPISGIRRIFELAEKVSDVVNLSIGEPDFPTPKNIKEAAKKAVDEGFTRYTPNPGFLELREAIAEKLKKENNIHADPKDEVVVTAGSTQAIFLLISVIIDEGDEVLIPTPAFVAYAPVTLFAGGKPVEVPMVEEEGYKIDVDLLKRKLTKRTKLFILNSPCNPTGSVLTRKNIEEVIQLAMEHDIYVLSDEMYEKYIYDGEHFSPASLEGVKDRVITVNGFSKTYAMTGWRIGYYVAPKHIVNEAIKLQMYNAVCPVSFIQKAAVEALKGPQDFIKNVIKEYDEKRRLAYKLLKEMEGVEVVEPKGAFYIFPRITYAKDSNKFCEELLIRYKVAVVPGSAFGESGEGHIRISYATSKEKLELGLRRLSDFLKVKGC